MAMLREVYIVALGFTSITLSLFLFLTVSAPGMSEYKIVGYIAATIGVLIGAMTLSTLVLI